MSKSVVIQVHSVVYLNGQRIQMVRDYSTLDEAREGINTLLGQLSTVETCMGSIPRRTLLQRLIGKFL